MLTISWVNLFFYTIFIGFAVNALHPTVHAAGDESTDVPRPSRRSDFGWAITFTVLAFGLLFLPA